MEHSELSLVPDPPPVRIGGPADLVGVLPWRLGFEPQESLVLLCLEGPRRRDLVVLRVDLPAVRDDETLAADLARRVHGVGASEVLLVLYTGDPAGSDGPARAGDLPRARLVRQVRRRLRQRGVEVPEAVLVRGGRWWSYLCRDPRCCPPGGTALPDRPTEATVRLAAEAVAQGDTVLPDRDALAASVAAAPSRDGVERARAVLHSAAASGGAAGARDVTLAAFGRMRARRADRVPGPDGPDDGDDAALLALGLRDTGCRDEVLTALVDRDRRRVVDVLRAAARAVGEQDAAPPCAALAWVAYGTGDGALASVALDRALRAEPDYSLALMLEGGIDAMVPPAELRAVSRSVREELGGPGPR